jgi:hypothetical protein
MHKEDLTMKACQKHDAIKALIELSVTIEDADEVINKHIGLETYKEKIAFLKGMFDVEVIDANKTDSDELIYKLMLDAIINAKYI